MRKNISKYSAKDFEKMKAAGSLAARALDYVCSKVNAGITTQELDDFFVQYLKEHGGNAACNGYMDYPKNICVSVNDEICHGIPGSRVLENGDIVSVDLVVELDGFHGDTCRTVIIGEVDSRIKLLVTKTKEAMDEAIKSVRPGLPISEIGKVIESVVKPVGFGIVKDYCGHGIGRSLHEDPQILHYYNPNKSNDTIIESGMCFTIEPMIVSGKGDTKVDSDEWTVRTKDRSICAQFEHTLGVLDDQVIVFTSL